MNKDFNTDRVANYINLVRRSQVITSSQLNCVIETCFKISYSIISSMICSEKNLSLSEVEKIGLSAKSISSLFELNKDDIPFRLYELIRLKSHSTTDEKELFFILFDVVREHTEYEMSLQNTLVSNYS